MIVLRATVRKVAVSDVVLARRQWSERRKRRTWRSPCGGTIHEAAGIDTKREMFRAASCELVDGPRLGEQCEITMHFQIGTLTVFGRRCLSHRLWLILLSSQTRQFRTTVERCSYQNAE
jgi:hypothetical protein